MSLTTFLNNNLAWVVIGVLVILILIILLKKKKPEINFDIPLEPVYSQDYPYPNEPIPPSFRSEPKPFEDNPFKQLNRTFDKEVQEYQKIQEKLKKQKNVQEMNKYNPELFPKNKPIKEPIEKPKKSPFWKIFWMVIAVSLLLIAITFFFAIKNNSFKSILNTKCEGTNVSNSCPTCPNNPSCPACPACNCPQNNFTCPVVNVDCLNSS